MSGHGAAKCERDGGAPADSDDEAGVVDRAFATIAPNLHRNYIGAIERGEINPPSASCSNSNAASFPPSQLIANYEELAASEFALAPRLKKPGKI
jgi:hypothetical protein